MKVGYNGRTYSDAEYSKINKAADDIIIVLNEVKRPVQVSNLSRIDSYATLTSTARSESLIVLCKKYGVIKLRTQSKNYGGSLSFYVSSRDQIKRLPSGVEFVQELRPLSVYDEILLLLKSKKELNMTELASRSFKFKKLKTLERKNLLDTLEIDGLIKIKRIKNRGFEAIIISLTGDENMSEEMKIKPKSEELIEQANKLLAAAEEAKKEEEKQLSKHELMNIQREINVEIIEMEKQIDGMIDSFSKLKSLFDKLKQS